MVHFLSATVVCFAAALDSLPFNARLAGGDTLMIAIDRFGRGLLQMNVCCPCSGPGGNVVQRPVYRV